MNIMEWRCTRPDLYPAGTSPSEMQGHYLCAFTKDGARAQMEIRYPCELVNVDAWRDRAVADLCDYLRGAMPRLASSEGVDWLEYTDDTWVTLKGTDGSRIVVHYVGDGKFELTGEAGDEDFVVSAMAEADMLMFFDMILQTEDGDE